jgi:7-carboxy-7-deazaguanine synthase
MEYSSIMSYSIKEVFYTLQGEGAHSGRPAVFCRFSGCNLWSGREADRTSAICQFCDTDFVGTNGAGGGKFNTAQTLASHIASHWPNAEPKYRFVVLTGGEPLLQVDAALISALHQHGFTVAVETNGTIPIPPGIDWVCVSPKANTAMVVHNGNELKLVFPQTNADPEKFAHLQFERFYLQAMDGVLVRQNTKLAIEYCKSHPQWSLSFQTHKALGIP